MTDRGKDDIEPEEFKWRKKSGFRWRGPKSEGSSKSDPTSDGTPGISVSSGAELFEILGDAGNSKEQEEDRTFAAIFLIKGKGEAGVVDIDPEDLSAELWVVKGEVEVHGAHAKADVLERLGLTPEIGAYEDVEFVSPGPFAVRLGDATLHGDPLSGVGGSPDVFIGGKPAWRGALDSHVCPLSTAGVPHTGGVVIPSDFDCLINGLPAVRVGDAVLEAAGGPNPVVIGAEDVLIGPTPPPIRAKAPVPEEPRTGIWKYLDANLEATVGYGKGEAGLGGGVDVKKGEGGAKAKAGAFGAVFRVAGDGSFTIPLSENWSITIGVAAEGTALTAGAEAGGGVSWGQEGEDGKKRWGVDEVGGKAGAGWFGGGFKISAGLERKN